MYADGLAVLILSSLGGAKIHVASSKKLFALQVGVQNEYFRLRIFEAAVW